MLADDLDTMLLETELDSGTAANYKRSIKFFSEWLGRPADRSDLVERTVNEWLRTFDGVKSKATIRGHKAAITRLWNWLADQNHVRFYEVRRLRKVKVTPPVPKPWSAANVRALLAGAETMEDWLKNGIRVRDLMRAWILLGYETGLRPKDLRLMKRTDIHGEMLAIVQNKTKVAHTCKVSKVTIEAIKKITRVESDLIFPASRNTLRRWELRLYRAAALHGFERMKGQGLGTLRKTAATEVCRQEGLEAASRLLGHISGTEMARRHYVAPDAIEPTPQPPSITDALATELANPRSNSERSRTLNRHHRSRAAS